MRPSSRSSALVALVAALAATAPAADAARFTSPKRSLSSPLARSRTDTRASPGEPSGPLPESSALDRALLAVEAEALAARAEFDAFLAKYEKTLRYASDPREYVHRLRVFASNLATARERQRDDRANGGSATHGVTKFMDLTPEEFRETYLGAKIDAETLDKIRASASLSLSDDDESASDERRPAADDTTDEESFDGVSFGSVSYALPDATDAELQKLPTSFDWRDRGAVTPPKNQGACGSCWTFSTTGAVEGAHFLKTGELLSLSEQQLVDCDHTCLEDEPTACDDGCAGGLPLNAMRYVKRAGLDLETDYPYKAVAGTCEESKKTNGSRSSAARTTISGFGLVSQNETQIAAALVKHGPLSIGIDAAWMQTYAGGVACPWLCDKNALDHGVLIVGYDGDGKFAPVRLHKEPYWIIKNSWGQDWGHEGFYHICKDKGSCGLNNMVVAAMG
jgi:cathepsin F